MIAPKNLVRPDFNDDQRVLRSELAVLRDRSIDAGDMETAKLCRVALLALNPDKPKRERVRFSGAQLWVIRESERLVREKLPPRRHRFIKRSTVIGECERLERESRTRRLRLAEPRPTTPTPLSEATGTNDTATPVTYLEEHRLRRAEASASATPDSEIELSRAAVGGQS